jgi:hypothetical protein
VEAALTNRCEKIIVVIFRSASVYDADNQMLAYDVRLSSLSRWVQWRHLSDNGWPRFLSIVGLCMRATIKKKTVAYETITTSIDRRLSFNETNHKSTKMENWGLLDYVCYFVCLLKARHIPLPAETKPSKNNSYGMGRMGSLKCVTPQKAVGLLKQPDIRALQNQPRSKTTFRKSS